MDSILEFIINSEGLYDLGSMIKLFMIIVGFDGVVAIIHAILHGSSGK